ncbi:MAG: hypothetical protein KF784_03155 [Fimbriimonadaceae bacterium]|nr:hypothetical protein [Fimbriimonadaceae bacterium]
MAVKKYWILAALGALALGGCQASNDSLYPVAKKGDDVPVVSKPAAVVEKIEPVLTLSGELAKIPPALQSDAMYYYSLTYDRPLTVKYTTSIVRGKGSEPELKEGEGTIAVRLLAIEENEVRFAVDRSSALAALLGTGEELVLNKNGVLTSTFNGKKLEKPVVEMPASLAAGSTWDTGLTADMDAQGTITVKMKNRVVGNEKVSTPMGEFDALKVESEGTASRKEKESGKVVTSSTKLTQWMVKGVGIVKLTLTSKDSDGNEQVTNLELAKPSN